VTLAGKGETRKGKREQGPSTDSALNKRVHVPTLRIIRFSFQVIFFVLLSAGLFQLASVAFPLSVIPVLSSSAQPGVTAISAFDALQYGMSAAIPLLLAIALAVFLLSAVIIGKGFCAFVCPFGFAQDVVGYIRSAIRFKEATLSPKTVRSASRFKYYILIIVLFVAGAVGISTVLGSRAYVASAIGLFSDVPFAVLSPADTLFATIPQLIIQGKLLIVGWSILLWLRVVILFISLGGALWIPRMFCRYLCPISALMAPMNRYTIVGLERNVIKCTGDKCKKCERACPMDVPIFSGTEKRFSKHPECIMCLVCKDVCEEKAIRFAII
jgi:ferredoxin-type protein NapH